MTDEAVSDKAEALPPLRWSRAFMRSLRDGLAALGLTRCPTCQNDALGPVVEGDTDAASDGTQVNTSFQPHPLDWMSIRERPALLWQGAPDDGEHHMFISTYCRWCYASVLFDSGSWWQEDHPDLTRLSDQEQEDGRGPAAS